MIKKLLTTFAVLTIMTAFAMAQVPLTNTGTITNKGTIKVGCTVDGSSVLNDAGTINNNATGTVEFTGAGAILTNQTAGVVTNDGTIKFTNSTPTFKNLTAAVITNTSTGLIQFDGTTSLLTNGQGAVLGGTITNDGKVLFTTPNPLFANVNGTVTNNADGIIQFDGNITQDVMTGLGTAATDRIGGYVIYNGLVVTVNNQRIQGDVYYTNLTLSGAGLKTFNDTELDYYVSGDYTAAVGSGTRAYGSSIFHYDGAATQEIFAESGTWGAGNINVYNDLELEGAVKTITGTTVKVATMFNNLTNAAATADLTMSTGSSLIFKDGIRANAQGNITATGATIQMEAGTVTTGEFAISVLKTVKMEAGSLFNVDAGRIFIAGDATNGRGTLALDGGGIDMADGTIIYVDGIFINSGLPAVLEFAKTSTVTYNNGLEILLTSADHSFGNLKIQGANNAKTPVGDIFVDGNFSLDASNLDMTAAVTGPSTLTMLDYTSSVTYGTGVATDMEEVIGKMNRVFTGAIATDVLVFNNFGTKVALTTPGTLTNLTLNVTPDATNAEIGGDADGAGDDVKRSISLEYGGQVGWMLQMSYGYTNDELHGLSQTLLRYREVTGAATSEKVATGLALVPGLATATTWGSLTLPGIQPTGANNPAKLSEVADGANLFLRSAPVTFFTIADGRWSNPYTWDEGKQPASTDNTEILHTVHVGFQGGADRADLTNGIIDERTNLAGAANQLAQTILIRNVDGAALVFGDNPSPGLPTYNSTAQNWAMNAAGIITNQNTNPNTVLANLDATELGLFINNSTSGTYQGLILFDDGTPLTKPISLSTQQLVNTGGEVNVGPNTILQICQ